MARQSVEAPRRKSRRKSADGASVGQETVRADEPLGDLMAALASTEAATAQGPLGSIAVPSAAVVDTVSRGDGLPTDEAFVKLATSVNRDLIRDGPLSPPLTPATPEPKHYDVDVEVELISDRLVNVPSPVAVVGRYLGLPLQGSAAEVDACLHNWLKRAYESGMIGARLGELTFLPLDRLSPRPMAPDGLLVLGMGDPSHFTRADLQYIYMNIVSAVKMAGFKGFSVTLANAPRYGLTIDRALLTIFEGAKDAYERLVCAGSLCDKDGAVSPLRITLVEPDSARYRVLDETLATLEQQRARYSPDRGSRRQSVSLNVRVTKRQPPTMQRATEAPPVDAAHESARDTMPTAHVIRFTISAPQADLPAQSLPALAPGGPQAQIAPARRQVFQYQAVTDSAAIPVRELSVEPYFVARIPEKLRKTATLQEQEKFGLLLPSYLLPEDFTKLIQTDAPSSEPAVLTLVVDRTSAIFPWEMAAIRVDNELSFFGPDLQLTRQFRSLLSDSPGVPPPLNDHLEVLVIADPGDDWLALPGALDEGLAVAHALTLAQQAWGDRLSINLTLRLGGPQSRTREQLETLIRAKVTGIPEQFVREADTCDPLEILALLMGNRYDVVHYAGHGVFDPTSGREGWVFNEACTLSAKEIFRIRQVPRLVFANACLSAAIETTKEPLPRLEIQQVSLAEAFFARGIENYIGAGWKVNDELAADFARRFYLQAMGVTLLAPDVYELKGAAPPATLGNAVASARRALMEIIRTRKLTGEPATIWGAYQHYGQPNSKLLPFTNNDADEVNTSRPAVP